MNDLRLEERIPVDVLPDDLKTILFSGGLFDEHQAVVANASRNGLSFIAEGVKYQKYEIGQSVKVKLGSSQISLKAKIIYMIKLSEESIKFGINFVGTKAIDDYHKLLDKK